MVHGVNGRVYKNRWKTAAIVCGLIILCGVYFVFDPRTVGFFPPCPVKKLVGLDCPGCGSQRAFHALLHLQIADAFRFNPLAFSSVPVLVYDRISGKGFLRHRHAPWVVLCLVMAYWIVRNLPFYPY